MFFIKLAVLTALILVVMFIGSISRSMAAIIAIKLSEKVGDTWSQVIYFTLSALFMALMLSLLFSINITY